MMYLSFPNTDKQELWWVGKDIPDTLHAASAPVPNSIQADGDELEWIQAVFPEAKLNWLMGRRVERFGEQHSRMIWEKMLGFKAAREALVPKTRKQEIIEERQFLGLILDHMHAEGGLLNGIPEFDKHAASLERLRKQNSEQFRAEAGATPYNPTSDDDIRKAHDREVSGYNPTAENGYDLTGLCDFVMASLDEQEAGLTDLQRRLERDFGPFNQSKEDSP